MSILGSAQVTSFLAESRPRSAPAVSTRESMTLNQGASCGGNMLVLNGVYSKSAEALKGASALLTSLDKELPEGVVSGGATEQFAVTYQIDLSKVNVSTPNTSSATETSGSETSGTAGLPTQDSSNGKESIPVTGLIKIGAGANATEAVLGFGFNAAMDNKGTTGAIDGNFSISANDALKLLKMSADGKLSFKAPSQEGSNKPINIAAETKSLFEIQAGSKPSLHLSGSYSGNGNISKEGAALSDETHMISADVKVAQSNSSDVKVSYSVTVDGKETTGSVEFVTDAYGQCVVKAPASLPKTETTSLSTAAM
ncbi:MAG: hypothetical protein NTV34_16265 [Proteobacteria bacterium]|nr:hypothetical protein [Pseudomonadota bacterium]